MAIPTRKTRLRRGDRGVLEGWLRTRTTPQRQVERARIVLGSADDDWILSTAAAAEADCLVTGDADLLDLGEHQGIPILSPGSFWEFEARFES
jgi:predicted nucleic acid-binding protein